jgi:hypothetical protein
MTVRDIEFKATGFLPLATFIAYVLIVCLLKWVKIVAAFRIILPHLQRRTPLIKGQKTITVTNKVGGGGGDGSGISTEKRRLLSVQESRILLQVLYNICIRI